MLEFAAGAVFGALVVRLFTAAAPTIGEIEEVFLSSHRDTPLEERAKKAGYR